MKKYRIISQYKNDGTITFIPQQRKFFTWNTFTIVRNLIPLPISFIKLCDAYKFIDDHIAKDKIEKEYGTKIHPYPVNIEK